MGFFLLGHGREHGDLRLISDEVYEDRQSALDMLSRMSAEPDFAHADAEVYVVDLDSATPVLLVKSAAPSAPVAEEPLAVEPAAAVEPAIELAVEPAIPEPPAMPVPVIEEPLAGDESAEVAIEETGPDAEGDAGVWEAPPVPVVETESPAVEAVIEPIAEAVAIDADGSTDLADALKRAAGSLEAEGIVAPASVGAPPVPDTPEEVPVAEAAAVDASATELVDASWPWEPTQGATVVPDAEPADPFLIPAFEEPSLDGDGLLAASDEEYVAPKPLIMGSYGDESEISSATEPALEVPAAVEPAPVPDADDAAAFDFTTAAELAGVSGVSLDPLSDIPADESIIGDLEPIEEPKEPASIEAPGVTIPPVIPETTPAPAGAEESDLASLTCDDCVYVNTCPNKEGLQPVSCGTFQWKSV